MPEPVPPTLEPWTALYALSKEKEVVGIYISGHPLDDYKYEIRSFCSAELSELNDLESLSKTEIKVAGIITFQETRLTKKGNQFGTIVLEDFSGTFKFFLFQEDFLKYRHFMAENTSVFIHAKVVPQRFDKTKKEVKIQQIEFLQDLREKKVRELKINVDNARLTASFIQDMHEILSAHQGNCRLKFVVNDEINNMTLNMPSKSLKVGVDNELLRKLEAENLDFQLG
jgi:DNA polymerase-3 subunit alpha